MVALRIVRLGIAVGRSAILLQLSEHSSSSCAAVAYVTSEFATGAHPGPLLVHLRWVGGLPLSSLPRSASTACLLPGTWIALIACIDVLKHCMSSHIDIFLGCKLA